MDSDECAETMDSVESVAIAALHICEEQRPGRTDRRVKSVWFLEQG